MPYQPYQSTWNNPYMPNNAFQQQIVPTVQTPTMQYPMQYQSVNGVVKVNGRESAMQYTLPPNSFSPALFDNNGKQFYIVSTDGTGAKTVETFDYTEHVEEPHVNVNGADFVSRAEFDGFVAKVGAALEVINNGIQESVPTVQSTTTIQQPTELQATNVSASVDAARGHIGSSVKPDAK